MSHTISTKGDFIRFNTNEIVLVKDFFYKVIRKLKSPGYIPKPKVGHATQTFVTFNIRYYHRTGYCVHKTRKKINIGTNPSNIKYLEQQIKYLKMDIWTEIDKHEEIRISFSADFKELFAKNI